MFQVLYSAFYFFCGHLVVETPDFGRSGQSGAGRALPAANFLPRVSLKGSVPGGTSLGWDQGCHVGASWGCAKKICLRGVQLGVVYLLYVGFYGDVSVCHAQKLDGRGCDTHHTHTWLPSFLRKRPIAVVFFGNVHRYRIRTKTT